MKLTDEQLITIIELAFKSTPYYQQTKVPIEFEVIDGSINLIADPDHALADFLCFISADV